MSTLGSGEFRIGPSLKGFQSELNAKLRKIRAEKEVNLTVDTKAATAKLDAWKARQGLKNIKIGVDVNDRQLKQLDNNLRRVEHTFKRSAFARAVRIQVVVAGAAALPALAQGALSATAALTELGQAALVLPGVFSGLAAAVGTLLTGLKGIGAAFSAASAGAGKSAQSTREYHKATRDLERAQRDMVQAVKDANREVQDQHDKLKRGALTVERAQNNVQKARDRLAKGGFDSIADWRDANLDLKESYLDLSDAVKEHGRDLEDQATKYKDGAKGTDTWRDALDRLASATETFTKAQDAANGITEQFISAMNNLGPAGKEFVNQILAMKDAWIGLQNAVSAKLLDGLGQSITDLANKRLPMLQAGMEKTASSLNGLFKSMLDNLGSDRNARFLSSIFDKTADAINRATPGFNSFVNGFLHLSEVGARFLPRLGDAFSKVMGNFERFIDRADSDGSLERWIDKGLNLVSSLGRSIGSIGSILESVTVAYEKATGNVGGFATTLEKGLGRLADWLKGPQGQGALIGYIKDSLKFLDGIKKAIPGIIDAWQSFTEVARQVASVVFPIFGKIGEFMERHAALAKIIIASWIAIRTLTPLWRTITKLYDLGITRAEKLASAQQAYKANLDSTVSAVQKASAAEQRAADAAVAQARRVKEAREDAAKARWDQAATQASVTGNNNRANRGVQVAGIGLDRAQADEVITRNALDAARRNAILMSDVGELNRMRGEKAAADARVAQLQASGKLPNADAELARQRALVQAQTNAAQVSQALTRFDEERATAVQRLTVAQDAHAESMRTTDDASRKLSQAEDHRYRTQEDGVRRMNAATDATKSAQAVYRDETKKSATTTRDLAAAHADTVAATKKMDSALATTAKNGVGKLSSAIGSVGGGLIKSISGLIGFIGPTLAIGGALYALDLWTQYNKDAADAVDRHRERVDALASSLSKTTGAATAESKQHIIDQLSDAQNTDTKEKYGDLLKVAADNGVDVNQLTDALNRGDNATVDKLLKPVKDKLQSKEQFTPDMLAALTGDQGAIDRYKSQGASFLSDHWRDVLDKGGILEDYDLADVQHNLSPDSQKLLQLLQVTGDVQRDHGPSVEKAQRENYAANGGREFLPGVANPFGPGATVSGAPEGGSTISIPAANATPSLLESVRANGGDYRDTGTGTVELYLKKDRADLYTRPVNKAAGGPVWGAGSARSDSIPAMLSNGEYVINAAAAKATPPGLLHAINAQRFGTGGPVIMPNIPGIPVPDLTAPNPSLQSQLKGLSPSQVLSGQFNPPTPFPGASGTGTTSGPIAPSQASATASSPSWFDTPFLGGGNGPAAPDRINLGVLPSKNSFYKDWYGPRPLAPASTPGIGPPGSNNPKNMTPRGNVPATPAAPAIPHFPITPAGTVANTHVGAGSPGLLPGPAAPGGGTGFQIPSLAPSSLVPTFEQLGVPGVPGAQVVAPGGALPPSRFSEQGLQRNTIKSLRAIAAAFPEIMDIGGVRADALKWHPEGLALDIMIPGQGGLNDPTTPEGLAEGNKIWEWMKVHADELGIDMNASLWQQKDHYNHIHLATTGGGYPDAGEGFTLPNGLTLPDGVVPDGGTAPATSITPQAPTFGEQIMGLLGIGGGSGGSDGGGGFFGKLGQIILQAIGGFFGIDLSSIFGPIGKIVQGVSAGLAPPAPGMEAFNGTDVSGSIQELVKEAAQAKAEGNTEFANQLLQSARDLEQQQRNGGAAPGTVPASAAGAVTRQSSPGDIAKYIYNQAIARGYSAADARMIVAQAKGESSFNPNISGGQQGDDEVIGLFQEKTAFSGGLSAEDRKDPVKNVEAYFKQLAAHGGPGSEIVDLLARTSGGGPAHPANGGRKYIEALAAQLADPAFLGFSHGGPVAGRGTGTSDSIPAYLSDGEFVMRAAAVKKYGGGFMEALNKGVPHLAGGGWLQKTQPVTFNPQQQAMLQPKQYAQDPNLAMQSGKLGQGVTAPRLGGGIDNWAPSATSGGEADPRAAIAAAQGHTDHVQPGLKQGIKGIASTLGSFASQAASMGVSAGVNTVAPGAGGMAGQAAGQLASGAFEIGGDVAVGLANILSSLAVGSVTGNSTGKGYGAPLLPQQQTQGGGTAFTSIQSGDIYTNNLDEYSRLQNRKDAQRSLPLLNRVG